MDELEDRDEILRQYLASKMGPPVQGDAGDTFDLDTANYNLRSDQNMANLSKGLLNASAAFSGGRYKPNTEDLDESNKERGLQIASNNQQAAQAKQLASQERQKAVAEYMAGKKQEAAQAYQEKKYASDLAHQQKMEGLAAKGLQQKGEYQNSLIDLKSQLAEAKMASGGIKIPHENQKMVDTLADTAAKRISTSNILEERLKKYRSALAAGNKDEAIKEGQQMLKILNSPDNPDAVGAEEAKRLGSFLEMKLFNLSQPGSVFGRDLDLFDTQVANSVNLIRDSAKTNLGQVEQIKSGKPISIEQVNMMPAKAEDGTVIAAPMPKVGEIKNGYKFLGGPPNDKTSWQKVAQ